MKKNEKHKKTLDSEMKYTRKGVRNMEEKEEKCKARTITEEKS